ncbi:hypothetical protein OHR68_43340 [Spirillospora sp. NBC_00431]
MSDAPWQVIRRLEKREDELEKALETARAEVGRLSADRAFVVVALDAWEAGDIAPHDALTLIRDQLTGRIPGEEPSALPPLVDVITAAIVMHRHPPDEWPDGPPREGEHEQASAEAAAILRAIVGAPEPQGAR